MTSQKPRLLIVGCARSGTGYTANLLSALGLKIGHEAVFGPPDGATPGPDSSHLHDVSWLAAPHLSGLGREWLVLHQVRDPRLVAGSSLGLGMFRSRTWQTHKARFWLETRREPNVKLPGPSYVKCAYTNAPKIRSESTDIDRAFRYWHDWNQLISGQLKGRTGARLHRTDQIDAEWLRTVFEQLELDPPPNDQIHTLLGNSNKTSNRRGTPPKLSISDIKNRTLATAVGSLAAEYGFDDF